MKKIILYFILLFLVFAALTPMVFGYLCKNIYYENIQTIKDQHPRLRIKILSYNVGWLESHVVTEINSSDPRIPFTFIANTTIQHGPLINTSNGMKMAYAITQTIIHVPESLQQYIPDNGQGLMKLDSTLAINGTTATTHFVLPPLTITLDNLHQFIWSGLTGDMITEGRGYALSSIQDKVIVGKGYGKAGLFEIWVEPVEYNLNATKDPSGLWNGEHNITIPSVIAKLPDGSLFSMEHTKDSAKSAVSDGFYNITSYVNIDRALIPSTIISTINNTRLSFLLQNISAAEYLKLTDKNKSANMQISAQDDPRVALVNMMLPLITPTFNLSFGLSTDTNLGAGSVAIRVAFTAPPKNIEELPNNLNADLTVYAAKTLVTGYLVKSLAAYNAKLAGVSVSDAMVSDASTKVKALLDDFMQNDYIKQDGNNYLVMIQKVNQDVILNTQKIDVNAVSSHIMQSLQTLNAAPAVPATPPTSAAPTAAVASAPVQTTGTIGYPDAKGMLPTDFPVYTDGKVAANQPFPGLTRKILPTNNDYQGQPGCYMACYSSFAQGSVYQVGDAQEYVQSQVRIPGTYVKGVCIPTDATFDSNALCNQKTPTCNNQCHAGGATDWFGLSR